MDQQGPPCGCRARSCQVYDHAEALEQLHIAPKCIAYASLYRRFTSALASTRARLEHHRDVVTIGSAAWRPR
jgi:hypothetical protein